MNTIAQYELHETIILQGLTYNIHNITLLLRIILTSILQNWNHVNSINQLQNTIKINNNNNNNNDDDDDDDDVHLCTQCLKLLL